MDALELGQILKRPLIIGASVSADHSSFSPGKKVALKYTSSDSIRAIASGGTPGREVWKRVTEEDLRDRTIVIGVDLFFWDSTFADPKPSIDTLNDLFLALEGRGIPCVIGDIPLLLPGRQPSRDRLNQAIREKCESSPLCRIMPFERIHREVLASGHLLFQGKRFGLRDLVPDGLHLSEVAGNYLAGEFEKLFRTAEDLFNGS